MVGGKTLLDQLLPLMAVFQQMRAVKPQFSGQMGRGDALRDTAQN
jgi:hypothetical protein